MLEEFVEVIVINWKKYNPRQDVKKQSWFRFENDFVSRSRYRMLTNEEVVLWLYILSERSKQKDDDVLFFSYDHAYSTRNFTKEVIDTALKKFALLKLVKLGETHKFASQTSHENANDTQTSRYDTIRTIRNEEEQPPPAENSNSSDADTKITHKVESSEVLAEPPPVAKVEVTQHQRKHVSNAKVQEVHMSAKFQEFMKLIEEDGYKLTPAQRRAMPRAFAEWGEDLDTITEFIKSKFTYANKNGRSEREAERYAINAFIDEAVQ